MGLFDVFSVIIPCPFSPRNKEDGAEGQGFPETYIYFCMQKC